jgi:putative phosphoribosyl transferase
MSASSRPHPGSVADRSETSGLSTVPAEGEHRWPVDVTVPGSILAGDLQIPDGAAGVVAFAHGSGSGRHSPRNQAVAAGLRGSALATLLLDLLTPDEEAEDLRTRRWRFDIGLLAERVRGAVDWLASDVRTRDLPVGLLGASTGAAAALIAARDRAERIRAVVSRGGRTDLAAEALPAVRAPVLLIVGGADAAVLELNRRAADQLPLARLSVVPGAGHLFEQPGALEAVTALAAGWFGQHLPVR